MTASSLALGCAATVAFAASGCGGSSDEAIVATDNPAVTFAPVVRLDPRERWMPMDARRFIDRSALWFAEDEGCPDRKIAVGRTLEDQRDEIVDWIYPQGLGDNDTAYWRTALDSACELDSGAKFAADELTRPQAEEVDRPPDLRTGEGFYLDLMDGQREGAPPGRPDGTPVYVERRREDVDGEPGLGLTYWMLFGMNEPLTADGAPRDGLVHEGDWESVEIVLRGTDGEYEPISIRLAPGSEGELPWTDVERTNGPGGERTHPVMTAERGSHTLDAGDGTACRRCPSWKTWKGVRDAAAQPWYGFGGAWGEIGATALTTGPLGPHDGDWPQPEGDAQEREAAAGLVAAPRPVNSFAPLVRHHPREPALPISAAAFLVHSTLKWKDGDCGRSTNIAAGRVALPRSAVRIPLLSPTRLGGARGGYRQRQLGPGCSRRSGAAYSTADHTRPYDRRRGGGGPVSNAGFYLNVLTEAYDGAGSVRRVGGRRLVSGVAAYYERRPVQVGGGPGLRLSYWMLYPHTESLGAGGKRVYSHEGGWVRIDVVLRRGRRDDRWTPVSARYGAPDVGAPVAWDELERVGGTHPVLYSARASHTPFAAPGRRSRSTRVGGRTVAVSDVAARCGPCVDWRTWDELAPLRAEAWYGYGGGWGLAWGDDVSSGPLGPVPFRR